MSKWFILLLFIIPVVVGEADMVWVMNMNYDKGEITLLDKTLKYGFFPDRNYQPEIGYDMEMVSFEDRVIYEFTFKRPNVIHVDRSNGTNLEGGQIVLNNVDFTLIVPYYKDAKEVRIYNSEGVEIGKEELQKKESKIKYFIGVVLVGIMIIMWYIVRRKMKK